MQTLTQTAPVSMKTLWAGRILSAVVILFLIFDGVIKLVPLTPVTETMDQLGYPTSVSLARGLGILTLVCTALYAIPRTSWRDLADGLAWRRNRHPPARRQPALHSLRSLSRSDGLGRTLFAR